MHAESKRGRQRPMRRTKADGDFALTPDAANEVFALRLCPSTIFHNGTAPREPATSNNERRKSEQVMPN